MRNFIFWGVVSLTFHTGILFIPYTENNNPPPPPVKLLFVSDIVSSTPSISSPPSASHIIPLPSSPPSLTSPSKPILSPPPPLKDLPSYASRALPETPAAFTREKEVIPVKFSYPSPGTSTREINKYFKRIKTLIEKAKFYPALSIKNREEGIVTMGITISAEGEVQKIVLLNSSGYKRLDKAGKEIIRKASPFPPPPGKRVMQLKIPIRFFLKGG